MLVAIYGGSCVEVLSHRGDLASKIEVPVPNVTSCDVAKDGALYVTTVYDGMDSRSGAEFPLSGSIIEALIGKSDD